MGHRGESRPNRLPRADTPPPNPVIYEARRLAVDRGSYELQENMVSQAKAARRSPIRIPDRPSRSAVEDHLVLGLALKLDAFCEHAGRQRIDLIFDELDAKVAQRYDDAVNRTRNIGRSTRRVKGWNPQTNSRVEGEISFQADAPFPLHTRFLGELHVAGKLDPLVLATDIVANSLYDHLMTLPASAYLNVRKALPDGNSKTESTGPETTPSKTSSDANRSEFLHSGPDAISPLRYRRRRPSPTVQRRVPTRSVQI